MVFVTMKDFPSCFGESGVQISDSSTNTNRHAQNMSSSVYQTHLGGRSLLITITWSKTMMGQGFSISVEDCNNHSLHKVDIKPWLFSKRKGTRNLDSETGKFDVFWDLSGAKFASGPEPLEGFYVAVVCDSTMVLLVGDMSKEAYRRTEANLPNSNAMCIAKKKHVFGKNIYSTKAKLCGRGRIHDIAIECETIGTKGPSLEICIDKKKVMSVKHLAWKFRGNQTIIVDGTPLEVFWDVHSWLFGASVANAVFMFQSCVSIENGFPWSCSQMFRQSQMQGLGFSLVLYAWKNQ